MSRKKPPCLPVYLPEPVKLKFEQLCSNTGERSMSARVLRLIHADIKANPDLAGPPAGNTQQQQ
jgi:hypothetical protein